MDIKRKHNQLNELIRFYKRNELSYKETTGVKILEAIETVSKHINIEFNSLVLSREKNNEKFNHFSNFVLVSFPSKINFS